MNKCPICGENDIDVFMEGIFDSDSTRVLECCHCGLQFLSPMMTEEEEEEYYAGYYAKQQDRHYRDIQLSEVQERSYGHYKQYHDVYSGLISGCENILEIGSGTGGFLKYARQHNPGAMLTAVERCPENVDYIKSCFAGAVDVVDDILELRKPRQFDCIVAFGVLEHVRDSRLFLSTIRERLEVGGKVALNVPNKAHALVYAYDLEKFRKFTYMKQHYYTFTERAFEILANDVSLRIKEFHYMQVWGLDNQLSWLRYGTPRDYSDYTRLLSRETMDSYNKDMIRAKTTDLMMAVLVQET